MSGLTGCETKNKAEIEQSFDKILAIYPTPNLESFYDMEGYRDDEFDNNDKGVWVLHTDMAVSYEIDGDLYSEGAILRLNRNTKKGTGFYFVRKYYKDVKKGVEEKKYPITLDGARIRSIKELDDKKLSEKIKNFQFFVQYGNFKSLNTYENIDKLYNPEVPLYELEYQLTNNDNNVQALRERYEIPTEKSPTLLLKGLGDLEGNSVGYNQLEFTFDKKIDVYFSDSIDFQPLSSEDIINE